MTTLAHRVAEQFHQAAQKSIAPAQLDQLKELTNRNHHSEAAVLGAKLLGARALEKKLGLVRQLHELEGSMPMALGQYRNLLFDALMEHAKRNLSEEDYKAFYGCF